MIDNRVLAGILYIVAGIVALLFSKNINLLGWFLQLLKNSLVLWCLAWSSIGIGAGLINTRNHTVPKDSNWCLHYLLYYGFVLFVVALISLTSGLYVSGESFDNPGTKFKSLTALIGLILGFLGNELYDLLKRLIGKYKII